MYRRQTATSLKKRVNVEIEEGENGATKWYLGIIKPIKDGICTISFDGFDSSHNIEVPENEIPSEDITSKYTNANTQNYYLNQKNIRDVLSFTVRKMEDKR